MRREVPGQTEMDLSPPAHPTPVATIKDVERVVGVLREHGPLLTAAEIAVRLGQLPTDNNKRKIRAVARASFPGILSFVGGDGYKLLERCELEEIWAAINALGGQVRDTVNKRRILLQAYHRRSGGKL